MSKGYLVDTTKCIGCRACQTACKQWNDLPAEHTALGRTAGGGYTNPNMLSAKTLTVVQSHEIADDRAPGGLKYLFAKRQCMHCDEPACASACPVTALHKTAEGAVAYDSDKCIGCRYCVWACPWGVPMAEWDSLAPKISKCDMCSARVEGKAATGAPACTQTCPAGALTFGDREELIKEARGRIKGNPGKYVEHIYGEKEAGGTNVLYLSAVPFAQLGFPAVQSEPIPKYSKIALGAVSPAVVGVGAALAGTYALQKRKQQVHKAEAEHAHPHFEQVKKKLVTPANMLLALLVAFGGFSFLARFVLGLGKATNLSDTHAWGLWIVFDLVWIAVAAGAFATAGIIYVLQRKDLYSMGRSAVLMGLLSYSFVMVTLLADLGLPWHFYQLGLQAPEHSAMFEVSWCVGLYVTILLLEFLPVPFEKLGMTNAAEAWRKYAPWYVVGALSLFTYLLSRSLALTGLSLAVFSFIAWKFRQPAGRKPEPIMLAIAAVTFSCMHQSSLGSLMLLMPDKLDHLWWSPVLPVLFLLSSVAAGIGLVLLVEMWIAKAYGRALRVPQLAALGQIAFWSLAVYFTARVADLAVRGELANAFTGRLSPLLLTELVLGGVLPLALLSQRSLREKPAVLGLGAFLTTGGVVLNRCSVVLFAMTLKGPLPQNAPQPYTPSVYEWGLSIGLIAATILLFGVAVRLLPVLPAEDRHAQ